MSIYKPSYGHERVDMIYDIRIEQVLSMKYFGTYTNEGPSPYVKCEKSYPHVTGKIAVLSRIRPFCRSNKIESLYENAKNNPKGRSLFT